MRGKVYLVGAGPGDPKLITLKAVECLTNADCILYDHLVNPEVLKYTSKRCEVIYVGKKGGKHTLPQNKINALLIKKAKEGKVIVRLKGGDPLIFGRGSEEARELARAKVPFEVVSGVTSAIAVPTYAGIPLTDRRFSSICTFVTGQEDPKKKGSAIDWEKLAKCDGTLVFLMGVKNLNMITDSLLKNGKDKDTPVAVITWGTLPEQRTLVSTLKDVVKDSKKEKIEPPSIIVVGEVVQLRKALNWFERKPLFGKRILVTRMEEGNGRLSALLENEGAYPVELATIQIKTLSDYSEFDGKVNEFSNYNWLIFTSANGIEYTLRRLSALGKDIRELKGPTICAIGPKTKEGLEDLGLKVEYFPSEFRAEAIVEFFKKAGVKGKRIIILRAKETRQVLPNGLKSLGAQVDCIPVYETVRPKRNLSDIDFDKVDCITFTSSSAVRNFASLFSKNKLNGIIKGKVIATIGPVTASTCKELKIKVDVEAKEYTLDGLTKAIAAYYKKR